MEREPIHIPRCPETNRQALDTYKHLGPLTAFQSGVNGTIIDVRKLGWQHNQNYIKALGKIENGLERGFVKHGLNSF